MLPHLVLIEQAVSRLFFICKCYGKSNCKKTAVGRGGTVGSKGGPGMAAKFGLGGPIILPWTVWGDYFRGRTVNGVSGIGMLLPYPWSGKSQKRGHLIP